MNRSRAGLERAFSSLGNPVAMAAIVALAVNALVLQPFYPSWLSGKLGNFAGLVFIPFLVALPLAFFIRRTEWVGLMAIGLTGVVFAAVKLIAPVNALVAVNLPIKATFDATDMYALPGLAVAWLIWKRSFQWRGQPNMIWKTAPLVLALVALMADSPAPTPAPATLTRMAEEAPTKTVQAATRNALEGPTWTAEAATRTFLAPTLAAQTLEARIAALPLAGIICLQIADGALVAGTYAVDFRSTDGGMTWQQVNTERRLDSDCERQFFKEPKQLLYDDPFHSGTQYWFYADAVKRSDRNRIGIQEETRIDPHVIVYDVEFDSRTGNIIAAVGKDGVMVRTSNGKWQFVGVGEFKR